MSRALSRRAFLGAAGAAALAGCAADPAPGKIRLRLSTWNIARGIFENPWGPIMAIAFLSLLPLLVVFLVFQRTFVQGIASTGLK